jgi:hypothetical protein
MALSDVPTNVTKAGGKGTPTGGIKPEAKLVGKSSVADVGVSPKKQQDGNPPSRKRNPAQMAADQDLPALNGFLNVSKEDSF